MSCNHTLIIGGTGMMKDVSIWFSDQGYSVSVIGRSETKHLDLKKSASKPERINSLVVDYNDHSSLERSVRSSIETYGPVSVVVSWTPNLSSLELVSEIVSQSSRDWKLFQVKGSRRYFEEDSLTVPAACDRRSIYLGFILKNDCSRWLTNKEIAEGVIKSIEDDKVESIIGTLHPYEKRPGY